MKSEIESLKGKINSTKGGESKKGQIEGTQEGSGAAEGEATEVENPFAALLKNSGKGNGTKDAPDPKVGNREGAEIGAGHGPLTSAFANKLDRLEDETIRSWGRYLRDTPFDRNMLPILEAIEKRVDELVGEIPQVSTVAGGRPTVPEKNRREIEDYFRDLSDDFGEENWIRK